MSYFILVQCNILNVFFSVMKPCIESICDPDHINEKLIEALHKHESVTEAHKNMYPYQTTYDNYMKVIKECDEVEHLKQIRSSIVSQILQAIPNNNFKQAAKGIMQRFIVNVQK